MKKQLAYRISGYDHIVRNILDHDATRSDNDITANIDELTGTCADAYPAGTPNMSGSRKICPGADMDSIIQRAIMVYGGASVDDAGLSQAGPNIDDGLGENYGSHANNSVPAEGGCRMYNRSDFCAGISQCILYLQADLIIADCNNHSIKNMCIP